MDCHIRQIKTEDIPRLPHLMQTLGYSLDEESLRGNLLAIKQKGGEVFIAAVNGEVVGCVAAIIDVRLAGGVTGEIVSLVVLPEFRGRGIGKKLAAQAEQFLGNQVKVMRVRANIIRSEAHGFYQSLGYRESKSQKIFIKNLEGV